MPGIVGFITQIPREQAEPQLLRMVETIRHESFYTTGTWGDESLGVYIGWTALKKSFSDGMPLCNERGELVLFFAGEEYPEPETTRRLRERGHDLPVDGSSYLVHLFEEESGVRAGLNGRFHGLLVDRARGAVTLFNDRYGIHRIYYHESREGFYFAAEAKAILAIRPELRRAAPRGLGELVSCGCVLENRTIFEEIHVLPPASTWVLRNGFSPKKTTYFQPKEWEHQEPLTPEAYYQELRATFSQNLPRYFKCQERIALSLTAGLDTRMILAWHKSLPGSLPCYSFGGPYRECEDVRLARQVATECDQPFEVIALEQDFLSRFAHYAERAVYLSDGCASVRCACDLYVNERAAKIAPVRMTGNYGGGGLRRLVAFKPSQASGELLF